MSHRTFVTACAIATLIVLAGCAGRKPNPIAVTQYGDDKLSCDALASLGNQNALRIIELSGEADAKVAQNVIQHRIA